MRFSYDFLHIDIADSGSGSVMIPCIYLQFKEMGLQICRYICISKSLFTFFTGPCPSFCHKSRCDRYTFVTLSPNQGPAGYCEASIAFPIFNKNDDACTTGEPASVRDIHYLNRSRPGLFHWLVLFFLLRFTTSMRFICTCSCSNRCVHTCSI